MDIKWQRNQFIKFFAKIKIRVGGSPNSYTIEIGDEFEFDGTVCRFSGSEFPQQSLRGAIKSGWASPEKDDTSRVEAFVPGRSIASATSVNRDLSRVQLMQNSNMGMDSLDEDTVINVGDRQSAMRDPARGHLKNTDNRRTAKVRGMSVGSSDVDDQQGVVISTLKTQTHRVVDVAANPGVARALETASYDEGFGRANVVHREGVTITSNLGRMSGAIVLDEDGGDGEVIGRIRDSSTRSREGVSIQDTSNIRQKTVKSRAAAAAPAPKKAAPAPAPQPAPTTDKLGLAQSIYPKFPNDWNFFAKTEDKLRKVDEIGATKPFIQALLASESKPVKKLIKEKYSKYA